MDIICAITKEYISISAGATSFVYPFHSIREIRIDGNTVTICHSRDEEHYFSDIRPEDIEKIEKFYGLRE